MKKNTTVPGSHTKILVPVLILLALGAALILFDRRQISQILAAADWRMLPGAVLVVLAGQACVTWSYVILAKVMGIRMPGWQTAAVFFVTNVMNRVIRSFGAAGFSVRCMIMKQHGVEVSDTLNSSFLHFFLGSLVMLGLLPLILIYVIVFESMPKGVMPILILLAAFGFVSAVCVGSLLFGERLRLRLAEIAVWLARKIIRRDVTETMREIAERAGLAMTVLRQDRGRFSAVMALLFAEWSANVILLSLCLRGFGASTNLLAAAAIFVLGTLAGVLTAIPGGVGVQEAVMTSLAVSLGISFEQAILAALLYRILQTFLPYLISIVFYPRLLASQGVTTAPTKIKL